MSPPLFLRALLGRSELQVPLAGLSGQPRHQDGGRRGEAVVRLPEPGGRPQPLHAAAAGTRAAHSPTALGVPHHPRSRHLASKASLTSTNKSNSFKNRDTFVDSKYVKCQRWEALEKRQAGKRGGCFWNIPQS